MNLKMKSWELLFSKRNVVFYQRVVIKRNILGKMANIEFKKNISRSLSISNDKNSQDSFEVNLS